MRFQEENDDVYYIIGGNAKTKLLSDEVELYNELKNLLQTRARKFIFDGNKDEKML